jgi:uncharacterized protein (TIGR00255 family)
MTGYGQGEVTRNRITSLAEVRSVNSRYLEVTSRLPRTLAHRENDVKELVRARLVRGKISVAITVTEESANETALKVNTAVARAYMKLLKDLKRSVGSREKITLDHLLKFSDILEVDESGERDEKEWGVAKEALEQALAAAALMREREGAELLKDLSARVRGIDTTLGRIEELSKERVPQERDRLRERVKQLLADDAVVDSARLETELALLADKLDVTEECVRFRSHNKFFLVGLQNEESAGRKLNFLTQEMNREANTIGSKANDADIAHLVVEVKEELEKIREQLQNIE